MPTPETKKDFSDSDIHVMPSEYFGVHGTIKPEVKELPKVTPVVAPPPLPAMSSPVLTVAATPKLPPKKRNTWLIVIIIVGLAIIVSLLSYLVYLNYVPKKPKAIVQDEPKNEVVVTPTNVAPTNTTPEIIIPPITNEEPTKFNPTQIKTVKLSDMLDVDSDKDGLTDAEELLLNTDMNKPDTDGDGFYDGEEFIKLYNPLKAKETLENSGLVTTYVNPTFDYDIYYSTAWVARAVDKANSEVIFSSALDEYIDVLVMDNKDGLTLRAWYEKLVPNAKDSEIVSFTSKSGLSGLWSPDGFTAYFVRGKYVYVINYNIGLKPKASYPNIFQMMVASFVFTGSEVK